MEKTKCKKYVAVAASVCVFGLMISAAVFLGRSLAGGTEVKQVFSGSTAAAITPKVIDGATGEPVSGAVIVVPEAGESYETDASGSAGVLSMPVYSDSRFSGILEKQWGEVSLITYAKGYVPTAVFSYMVTTGQTREGPLIMLFPEGDTASSEPYSLVEPPYREWVNSLVEKYRPQTVR